MGPTLPGKSGSKLEESVFQEIEHLITRNKIYEAIERLRELPDYRKEAMRFSKRWHDIQERKRQPLRTVEDVITEQNKLVSAILELLSGRQETSSIEIPDTKLGQSIQIKGDYFERADDQVLICYAEEDREFALQLYQDIQKAGGRPWMAHEDALPGQKWGYEIQQALKRSTYVLMLISHNSINKRGYEYGGDLKYVLDTLDKIHLDRIYLIPVRLDDSKPLDRRLKGLQWVDLWPSSAYQKGLQHLLWRLELINTLPQEEQGKEVSQSIAKEIQTEPPSQEPVPRKSKPQLEAAQVIHLRSEPQIFLDGDLDELERSSRNIQNHFEDSFL